jgi:hypothetical protein
VGTTNFDSVEIEDSDGLTVNDVITPQRVIVTAVVPGTSAATATNYGPFFIADRAYQVVSIKEAHGVVGSDASAVTLNVEKLTGTEAAGAGDALLTDNTNAGFSLKATANTVQTGTLTATTANLQLAAGDRLCLKDAGTLTAVDHVVVTVELKAI